MKSKIIQKTYIYNIEENGGKPQKIYIRPYYNKLGLKKKMENLKIYDNVIKSIVKKSGGFREKDIMKNPYIIRKTETWNNGHKVLNIIEKVASQDGHKNGFSVDLVTMKICG